MLLTRGNSFYQKQFHSNSERIRTFSSKPPSIKRNQNETEKKNYFSRQTKPNQRTRKVSDSETFWKFIVFSGSHFTSVQFFSIRIIKHFSIENPLTCISKKRNVCIFYAFSHINNLCLTNNIFNYSILLRKKQKIVLWEFFYWRVFRFQFWWVDSGALDLRGIKGFFKRDFPRMPLKSAQTYSKRKMWPNPN